MDPSIKKEIDDIVEKHGISREDVEMDLDTRDNYPGEFYVMALAHIKRDDIYAWLEETA